MFISSISCDICLVEAVDMAIKLLKNDKYFARIDLVSLTFQGCFSYFLNLVFCVNDN